MSFQGPIYTDAGKALHNRLIGTGTLKFTKMQMGDGSLGGTTIAALTALINPLVTMEVQRLKQYSDYIVVTAPFTNATITTAFNWREIGLFAADPDYPDDRTKDILFCYQNAYSSAAPIPPGSQEFIERLVNIPIKLSDVSDVTITISASLIYALKDPLTGKIYPDDIPDLNYISVAQKGAANGVATLGEDGKITPAQIDYLLKSIVAAADYDPTATYAAGAYCIKTGTFYKCTTPITTAEIWNAAHWTETTVAAELLAIIAALAEKANQSDVTADLAAKADWNDGFINEGSLTAWAESKTINTGIATSPATTDVPYSSYWMVNVYIFPAGGWKMLTATCVMNGDQFYNIKNASEPWSKWIQVNRSEIGVARITTGSYVGTGTYGASNPCSLTFDFEPKVVFISSESGIGTIDVVVCMRDASFAYTHRNQTSYYIRLVWSGKTLSWTDGGSSADMQLNASGVTYKYVAIG